MEIGNRLLELRKQNNLSQEHLAEKMGVARQTISKWELGETSPDLNQAKELSKIFNVSLDDITNNDVKNLIITKLSKTEKSFKTIINFLKIILLTIVILVIVLVSIIFFREYFDVQPVESMQSVECIIDGKEYSYQIWMNNETSYVIDKIVTNDSNLNLDTNMYININQVIEDIQKYATSNGGYCGNSK